MLYGFHFTGRGVAIVGVNPFVPVAPNRAVAEFMPSRSRDFPPSNGVVGLAPLEE